MAASMLTSVTEIIKLDFITETRVSQCQVSYKQKRFIVAESISISNLFTRLFYTQFQHLQTILCTALPGSISDVCREFSVRYRQVSEQGMPVALDLAQPGSQSSPVAGQYKVQSNQFNVCSLCQSYILEISVLQDTCLF